MAGVNAFLKILVKEASKPAKPLVLGDVSQFVGKQSAVTQVACLNEDAVAQRHANGPGGHDAELATEARDAIIAIIAEQGKKLVKLASDIIAVGLSPIHLSYQRSVEAPHTTDSDGYP